jgi:hypothetical protein
MAVPPKRQSPQVGTVNSFATGVGLRVGALLPTQPAPPPVDQTSYVTATDSVAFSVAAGQTITVTFPNLPNRSAANPRGLAQSGGSLAVATFNTLHFAVALQGVTGPAPTATPLAVDVKRVRVPGPFLGGGNTYEVFQATITGSTAGGSSGNVVGTLTLMVEGSS